MDAKFLNFRSFDGTPDLPNNHIPRFRTLKQPAERSSFGEWKVASDGRRYRIRSSTSHGRGTAQRSRTPGIITRPLSPPLKTRDSCHTLHCKPQTQTGPSALLRSTSPGKSSLLSSPRGIKWSSLTMNTADCRRRVEAGGGHLTQPKSPARTETLTFHYSPARAFPVPLVTSPTRTPTSSQTPRTPGQSVGSRNASPRRRESPPNSVTAAYRSRSAPLERCKALDRSLSPKKSSSPLKGYVPFKKPI
jgi:hypothetical protein